MTQAALLLDAVARCSAVTLSSNASFASAPKRIFAENAGRPRIIQQGEAPMKARESRFGEARHLQFSYAKCWYLLAASGAGPTRGFRV